MAHEYVRAGSSGDWVDAVPLSGARWSSSPAGCPAAATDSRGRAAVHTLSDLDLEPDELLARLDDLARCLKGDDSPKMAGGRPWLTPQPRKSAAGTESARRAST